ncbi:unnamed protein product [Anisakis simplex]|uniref:ABC transporter domain-containing protein n=1 Tax=Anisakis simplex TaxID=6269 RepID=A0A0M3JWU7_ANISI|nr:unnamed protein product [Anisakis simplex]
MSLAETVNLLDNTSVVLDLEESAMKPVIGDSVDSDLVGRSLEQNIPYWDDERVFQRAVRFLLLFLMNGSGKTTLLNVLTKRNLNGLHVDGVVSINGQQLDASEMRRICAYVQQDDLFVGSMTVKEHLTFYAALRMGNLHSYEERKKRVEETMRDVRTD